MRPRLASRPAPMREVAIALIPMRDASDAIQRGLAAWNASQLTDAIRSVEFFLERAKGALANHQVSDTKPAIIKE